MMTCFFGLMIGLVAGFGIGFLLGLSRKGIAARYVLDNAVEAEPCPPGIRMVPWYETYCQICDEHTDEEWPTAWPTIQGAIEHRDTGAERTEKGEYICEGCAQGDDE